ncbi:MAG TPA: DegV family protein [Acidimicrobiales bacterium]|nr:DegV family protein [Acidimicrobiales bacterium]
MAGVRVVTDTACDLPDEIVNEHGIGLVPLRIRFGSEEFVDRVELSTKEFWARCAGFSGLPETSAPSPGQFKEAFENMAAEGASGVVCVNLSSKMSATIQAARQAAAELEDRLPVKVVDSLNVTLGQGLITMEAAKKAAEGGSVDEVAQAAENAASRMHLLGVIDTLENLKRGGRIGGAQAFLGTMLSIKPVIQVLDGVVEPESRQRTRGKALRYVADKARSAGRISSLAVFSADAPDMDSFLSMLEDVQPSERILAGDVGPVIGTHAGPGAIGVAWIPA